MAICCHHQCTCTEERRRAAPFCESLCSHLKHSVILPRSLVSMPFLHLAAWSMFPCHHFWWNHFTCNASLSLGCLKSRAGAGNSRAETSPRVSAGWGYPLRARRSTSPRSSLLLLCLPRWKHFWQYKRKCIQSWITRTKEQGWALASVFMCKTSTTHTCLCERGVKVTPTLLGTTTVEGGVEVHFQMTSGSTALRWVSEEEPPQRSLTPLSLAELLLAASLLLSYFLGKLQKFTAFSQCPQQQFWATCSH